jgi:hypothetical protein
MADKPIDMEDRPNRYQRVVMPVVHHPRAGRGGHSKRLTCHADASMNCCDASFGFCDASFGFCDVVCDFCDAVITLRGIA